MGTEKDGADLAANVVQFLQHLLVDLVQHVQGQQLAGDARLVGHHHHLVVLPAQAGDGLETPGNGAPLFRGLDELVGILVDDPVTVKDDQARFIH